MKIFHNYFKTTRLNIINIKVLLLCCMIQVISGYFVPCSYSTNYRAAIFDEPGFPAVGQVTPANTFLEVFAKVGIESVTLTAAQLSEPNSLNSDTYDLLVVPTGASFPVSAKNSLIKFLQNGGDLLCTGGYAFDSLFVQKNNQWIPCKEDRKAQLERARDPNVSLIKNGGFEEKNANWSTSRPTLCTITDVSAFGGQFSAKVTNSNQSEGARWESVLPVKPGENYLIGAQVRTESIHGIGFGYLAVYQYDAKGNLLQFVDFSQFRQPQDWKRHEATVHIDPQSTRVYFYGGLYQAEGTLWIDNATCAAIDTEEIINAHFGSPGDGLVTDPTQLMLYSPDQTITGGSLHASPALPELMDWQSPGEISGYEATAQLNQNAQWSPLIYVQDAAGRNVGAAGALVKQYQGRFAKSVWALFGVTNRDIFAGVEGKKLLEATINRLKSGVFIQSVKPDSEYYKNGETVTIRLTVNNTSRDPQMVSVSFKLHSPEPNKNSAAIYSEIKSVTLAAQSSQTFTYKDTVRSTYSDFVVAEADVSMNSLQIDHIESGFAVEDAATVMKGTLIRYRDNAFELSVPNGSTRRVSLWGTDTYGNMFLSPSISPLNWFRDMEMMQDYGLHLWENLQMIPSNGQFTEKQWRQMDAVIQMSQRFGLPYMAGLYIGQNVVVSDGDLVKQAEFCRQFAARYHHVPGLIYYLNGDFQLNIKDIPDIQRLWNDFLRNRYKTDEALRAAWKHAPPNGSLGSIPIQMHLAETWFDVRTKDLTEFQHSLMQRWIGALCKAVRTEDQEHPITSEYYQRPLEGIDVRMTIGEMDAANFGYFDPPKIDFEKLMATVKWNDMRLYGKTVNIGEFGVKTHDAWAEDRGGAHYHIQRTEAEQLRLFWRIAHTAFSMGVTKIQNWCWSDDPDRIFPWGMAYSNPLRPKQAAKLYRNLRCLAEQMTPEYIPSEVVLAIPDTWRAGTPNNSGYNSIMNAIECLLATNVPFDVANESKLSQLLAKPPRFVVFPLAYAISDETIDTLKQLAEKGCKIYLSGDPSVNPLGLREEKRLEDLCGVRLTGVNDHASGFPQVQVSPLEGTTDTVFEGFHIYRHAAGSGSILYAPEPWESFPDKDLFVANPELTASSQSNHYLSILPMADIMAPLQVKSTAGTWRAMDMKSGDRRWTALSPRGTVQNDAIVEVTGNSNRFQFEFVEAIPSGILWDKNQQVIAAMGSGTLTANGQKIISGNSPWMFVSLDHKVLMNAESLLISSVEGGKIRWESQAKNLSAVLIDRNQGKILSLDCPAPQNIDSGWELETSPNDLYLIAPKEQIANQLQQVQSLFTGVKSSAGITDFKE